MNNIPLPTRVEKNIAINDIIEKGLYPKKTLFQSILSLHNKIGFRYILGDISDIIVVTLLLSTLLNYVLLIYGSRNILNYTFMTSPIFYIILSLLTELKEKNLNMYELKMTCKYTLKEITALRLLYYSLLGIVFSSVASSLVILKFRIELLDIILVSLLGLSIASLLVIVIMKYVKPKYRYFIFFTQWILLFVIPNNIFGSDLNDLLKDLPHIVILIIIFILSGIYLFTIKKYFIEREGLIYVNS